APGDMLYLPPGIGHHGVAEDDCITLSIGFRAPTIDDILTSFTDFLSQKEKASEHLDDPDLQVQSNPGTIAPEVIDRLDGVIREQLGDRRNLALWFGQFATAPKSLDIEVPAEEPAAAEDLAEAIRAEEQLRWNECLLFAYHQLRNDTAQFVDRE